MAIKHKQKIVIARRYATALFMLAKEKDVIDSMADEVSRLQQLLETNDEICELLASPLISDKRREESLSLIISVLKCSPTLSWFIGIISSNHRLGMLKEIVTSFMDMVSHYHNEHEVTVISAKDLEKDQITKLAETLSTALDAKVKIKGQTDVSLIRGAVVRTRTMVIDFSLRSYLEKLEQHIKEA